jgi:hypothetical protein
MINLSTALDANDLDRAAQAYAHAFQRLADAGKSRPDRSARPAPDRSEGSLIRQEKEATP